MDNPVLVALGITLAGMTLLFLALAFFYGLLTLISSALHDGGQPSTEAEPTDRAAGQAVPDRPAGPEPALQAAAIAVALARAESEGHPAPKPAPAGLTAEPPSPWWSLHQGQRTAAGSSPWRKS